MQIIIVVLLAIFVGMQLGRLLTLWQIETKQGNNEGKNGDN